MITLDGRWGSGKSTFVKQWAGLMRSEGAPVIYFDAFGNDHYDDAFLALSAQVYAAAKEDVGANAKEARNYLSRAKKAGRMLVPIAARIGIRAATAGVVNVDELKEGSEALQAAVAEVSKESEKWVENVVSEQLRGAAEEKATVDAFRETLSTLAGKLSDNSASKFEGEVGESGQFPLVVIADDPDRCRPPFALSVIERIKHLFLVDRVCFVLLYRSWRR